MAMRTITLRRVGAAIAIAAVAGAAAAQTPRVTNAKLTTRPAAAGLQREISSIVGAQTAPAWIGYAVPIVDGERQICCGNYDANGRGWYGRCGLEGTRSDNSTVVSGDAKVKLEGPTLLFVLLRVENRAIGKVRAYSEDCELDAGGLPLTWLTDVKPSESVALLLAQVDNNANVKQGDSVVSAIALHKDPSADAALDQLLDPRRPEEVRRKVTFWLGSARGRSGVERLKRVLRDDPSDRVREQATFGLSVSPDPDALATLIATARDDRSTRVRGQALFWLGQKAGRRAAETITSAINNDPETEVKKKAVFALSQLPKDEGVPLLIQVARTNKNPVVRKQAIFWLGQSKDPRALQFFEEVLKPR
jgi:HEAT repeat protein